MPNVEVDSIYIENLLKDLDNGIVNIHQTILFINDSYRNLGTEWKDAKYKELGKIVDKCTEELGNLRNELFAAFEKLYSLFKIVLEYETIDLVSGSSSELRTSRGRAASFAGNAGLLLYTGYRCFQTIRNGSEPLSGDNVQNYVTTVNNRVHEIDQRAFQEEQASRLSQFAYNEPTDTSEQTDNADDSHRLVVNINQFGQIEN